MTLPIDLVLVRHGQSEGNLAKRLSEAGDHSAYTKKFLNRHSSSFRLTELGRHQAQQAGKFLQEEFCEDGIGFDRYITSAYNRARETAGLLDLSGADWFREPYLVERNWGKLDIYPENERRKKFAAELRRRKVEPFFWEPPDGESFLSLCLRIDRVLLTLHNECADKRVLIVCHGEVMRALQIKLERMTQERFKKLTFSQRSEDRIHNCQILHYTRRDPSTGKLAQHADWVRWIRPTETPVRISKWKKIIRPRYTNEQLLKSVARTRAMIT